MIATSLLLAALAARPAEAPWEGPAFQADPAAMMKAATALPPPRDAEVDLLFHETTFTLEADGTSHWRSRVVFRPLTRQAAEGSAPVSVDWAPWREERPTIRARIIDPAGGVHWLDPATLSEAGAGGEEGLMYTDDRVLQGPLPAMEAGVLVEEEFSLRGTAALFDAGVLRWYVPGRPGMPTRRALLRLEVAPGVPFAWRALGGLGGKPREQAEGGRRVLTWDWRDLPANAEDEPSTPLEEPPVPRLAFTTARSWQEVAARYGQIAEGQLAGDDLRDLAPGVVKPGATDAEAAQALMLWIGERVRYTGLELGRASIVPTPPREVLRRRYGDCKDLGLLLTALLRQSGHPARLALLRAGPTDVEDELPGFGPFNHVVVAVGAGPAPLWVDATAALTPVGELPTMDQGHRALVAAPGTTGLTRLPEAPAAANAIAVRNEVVLPEVGLARVIQAVELRGASTARIRQARRHRPPSASKAAEEDDRTTRELLDAETPAGPPRYEGLDPASPVVRIRREADGSRWGVVSDDEAEVSVGSWMAFEALPHEAMPPEKQGDRRPDRKYALMVSEPGRTELRYRVVLPPGWEPVRPLPSTVERTVGPLRFRATFTEEPDGGVVALYRTELAARRLEAAEVNAVRKAVAELRGREVKLHFRRTAAALMDAGRWREAVVELRRLADLHPAEARHHDQLALALLRIGLGEAARREARRAVELEPKSEWSRRVLSIALAHDALGRWLAPGCDLAGAVAEQRRSLELGDTPARRLRLATLLERGARCARYAPGARLEEAIALLRKVQEEEPDEDGLLHLVEDLIQVGRPAEALPLARQLPEKTRPGPVLAAVAAAEGLEAARRQLAALPPAARLDAAHTAATVLGNHQQYALAGELLRLGAADAPASEAEPARQRGELYARATPRDTVPLADADPVTPVRRALRAALLEDDPARALDALVLRLPGERVRLPWLEGLSQPLTGDTHGVSASAFTDLYEAHLRASSDGDRATGYRVAFHLVGRGTVAAHLLPAGGKLRIVGGEHPAALLAAEARRSVARGDLATARRLLAWAQEAEPSRATEDAPASLLAVLWSSGAQADAEELRTAAAAVGAPADREALADLRARHRRASWPARGTLGLALAAASAAQQEWQEAAALAQEVLQAYPSHRGAAYLRARAMGRLRRLDEVRGAVNARLAQAPSDLEILRVEWEALSAAGEGAEGTRVLEKLLASGRADPADYNNAAWTGLLLPALPGDAVSRAQKAVELTREGRVGFLHTLAAVQAAAGSPSEAMEALRKAVSKRGNEASSQDWLVLGRLAEHLGLVEDASAAYQRVKRDAADDASSAGELARAWSARLPRATAAK